MVAVGFLVENGSSVHQRFTKEHIEELEGMADWGSGEELHSTDRLNSTLWTWSVMKAQVDRQPQV